MYLFTYILLVLQVGLRWETGTDWYPYLNHFESISDFTSTSPLFTGFEFGYSFLVWLVKLFTSEYSIFLLFHAIIYYLLLFYAFSRYTPYFYVALLLFYTASMGVLGSNRQLMALAICIYSLKYVVNKSPLKFITAVIIAVNFHTTAFIFGIYYFINRNFKLYTLILILAGSLIIGLTSIPVTVFTFIGELFLGSLGNKVVSYLNSANKVLAESKLSLLGLLKRCLFVLIFYYNRKELTKSIPYYNLFLNGYTAGLAVYFMFSNSLLILVNRGSLFFNIMEPLLLSSQFILYKRTENRVVIALLILLLSILLFFQSIAPYPDLFLPYKGIFINFDYDRVMF